MLSRASYSGALSTPFLSDEGRSFSGDRIHPNTLTPTACQNPNHFSFSRLTNLMNHSFKSTGALSAGTSASTNQSDDPGVPGLHPSPNITHSDLSHKEPFTRVSPGRCRKDAAHAMIIIQRIGRVPRRAFFLGTSHEAGIVTVRSSNQRRRDRQRACLSQRGPGGSRGHPPDPLDDDHCMCRIFATASGGEPCK